MAAGGVNPDIPDEVWEEECQRLKNQVQYDPAFTAQLNRISAQIPEVAETIVRIIFDKPKPKK